MEDYREIIRSKRIALGWSQYKLAKLVGITQSFMNEIESGKKAPPSRFFPYLPGAGNSGLPGREVIP